MKRYTNLYTVLCLVLVIVSCNARNDTGITGNEKRINPVSEGDFIKLTWLAPWYEEGMKEVLMREIAREFAFLNQDIDFTIVFPQEVFGEGHWWSNTSRNLLETVSRDEWPYDIMITDRSMIGTIISETGNPSWATENLVDFSEEEWFVKAHKDGILSEEFVDSYHGLVPGPIIEGNIYILYVSEIVENKLGLQVKRHDMEFNDFVEYAEAVNNFNLNNNDKVVFFSLQQSNAFSRLFQNMSLSVHGKENFSSLDESVDALTSVYSALEQLAGLNAFEQQGLIDPSTGDIFTESVLMPEASLFHLMPSWMYLLWDFSYPDEVGFMKPCEIPSMYGQKPPFYPGGFQTLFAVPKRGKNVEAAKKLIRYMTTSEIGEKWISYTRNPTGLGTVISMTDFGQGEFDLFFRHIQQSYGINLKDVNIDLTFRGGRDGPGIVYLGEEVSIGRISADEAINRFKNSF
jgi:ABC-type glycerol-3-phosphate transport system substrate-binding protein